jgi:hypothetical protein
MSEALKLSDVDAPFDYEQPPDTPSTDRAEEHLRLLGYWRTERYARQRHAETQTERIILWLEREHEKIDAKIAWHEQALQGYLWQTGKKSVHLIHGRIARRKGRERIEISDEETFLATASSTLIREQLLRQPDKKAILAHIKAHGEIPTGIDLVRGDDTLHIETGDDPDV